MTSSRIALAFGIALGVFGSSGCGSREYRAPNTVLNGTVKVDGKTVPIGVVTAYQNGSKVMETTIEVDGNYQFLEPPSGQYQLTVTGTDVAPPHGKPVKLPAKYAKPESSGLTATVTSDQTNTQDLLLQTK